jgi:phosphoribosylanthranilate isomerase
MPEGKLVVKICGVTTLEDARAAVQAGADMLGYNFYPPSPRCLTSQSCIAIQSALKREVGSAFDQVTTVGIFVNASLETIQSVLDACALDLAQLSGDEPPETLAALGSRAFKALRAPNLETLNSDLARYPKRTAAPVWLLDAHHAGTYGGSGQVADWSLAADLASREPILLAGGLTPENVAEAVRKVGPWGVDVASGVESSPGRKDAHKMFEFIQAARQAASQAVEKENIR